MFKKVVSGLLVLALLLVSMVSCNEVLIDEPSIPLIPAVEVKCYPSVEVKDYPFDNKILVTAYNTGDVLIEDLVITFGSKAEPIQILLPPTVLHNLEPGMFAEVWYSATDPVRVFKVESIPTALITIHEVLHD